MRRQDYQSRGDLRENYRRRMNRGNNVERNYYYPQSKRHHWIRNCLVIILCLAIGWIAADHFFAGPKMEKSSQPRTEVSQSTSVKKNLPQQNNQGSSNPSSPQPNIGILEREMDRLDVNSKDQLIAANFYQKQTPKNQVKMDKMIKLVNKVVPSDVMKRQALSWILR